MTRTPIPADLAASEQEPLITERQAKFLRSLCAERDIPAETRDAILARVERGNVTKKLASEWIGRLLPRPKLGGEQDGRIQPEPGKNVRRSFTTWDNVPDGRYALRVEGDELNPIHFYTIRTSGFGDEWDGFQRVKRHVSDERFSLKGAARREVMDRIAADPRAAAVLYGHETNHCCICGRELTREDSREAGIGPVCAASSGW